jgi:hypothetical protein
MSRFSKAEREVVLDFRRAHLNQQKRERDKLDVIKLQARNLDEHGRPTLCVFFSDAISQDRGDCPFFGSMKNKIDDSKPKIMNRTVGVEVYCGPIATVFLYHIDQFVSAGSNVMIEVQRQAMHDLAEKLNQLNMSLPPKAHFQFDNCGEQKVIYMNTVLHMTPPYYVYNYKIARRTNTCSSISACWWSWGIISKKSISDF